MTRIVKKPEERRKEIIAAAKTLFLEKDYARTTMQDVMHHLNIAKGTIYHYFKSKEELLDAVVDQLATTYCDQLAKALAKSKEDAIEKMRLLIRAGRVAQQEKATLKQLHRPGNSEMHTRLLAVTTAKIAPLYAEVITQGCQEKVFHVVHPLESAELLIAGIQFLTDQGCYGWEEQTLERRRQAIPALIEAQLKAPKDSFQFLIKED